MKAILFDWDGTLIDTAEHVYEANVEVIKSIGLPAEPRALRSPLLGELASHVRGARCS